MVWHIGSAYCSDGGRGPYVKLFDVTNGETWGPFEPNRFSELIDIRISCVIGDKICYGAWFEQKNIYDCSRRMENGDCTVIAHDPEYFWWGCGLDCRHLANSLPLTCHECMPETEKSKYLNCGS